MMRGILQLTPCLTQVPPLRREGWQPSEARRPRSVTEPARPEKVMGDETSGTVGRRVAVAVAVGAVLARPRRAMALAAATATDPHEDEVVNVIDGDTVKLKQAGRCRLIGVNTPETVAPRQKEGAPPDCYGPEASALTKGLLPPGSKVRIEFDVEPTDKYGRQLVYVYRANDGLFINGELVKKGAARRLRIPPNVRYDDFFTKLDRGIPITRKRPNAAMNLVLLLYQEVEEINKTGFLLLPATDRRARHIVTVLKPTPGATIRVGCVGVGVGRACVVVLERGEVRLSPAAACGSESAGQLCLLATPSQPHVELLLAMPRPKVMMRLWSVLAQLGLRRIVLTNAWRVEKPYFSSQATDPSKYTPELLEGLEQAVCTTLPEVQVELRLKPFVEDALDTLFPSPRFLRLLCHPGTAGVPIHEAILQAQACGQPPEAVLLAVERSHINTRDGKDIPIGFFQGAWESAYLTSDIARILVEEVLGYHTWIHPEDGRSAASTPYALAGCLDFNNPTNKQCGINETRLHVCVDCWSASYASVVEDMKDTFPHNIPVDLGSMGYEGEESMYVTKKVLQQALDAEGLTLDFYRGYNLTHHTPKQYFDGMDAIDLADLFLCEETDFYKPEFMAAYARWTGDAAGIQVLANGKYAAKCHADKWWISPQCRSDTSTCIPVITAGVGWKLQAMMFWSTAYGLPTAIAVASSWNNYVSIVSTTRSLFYWWVPDATFITQQPQSITFPPYSASEWAQGNMRTAASGTYISKAVSSNFPNQAPRVSSFIANVNFELAELMDLLLTIASGTLRYDVACQWVRDNKPRWQEWLPIETNCITGFGLADAAGSFVTDRANATTCEVCTPGRFSQEYLDNTAPTRRCVLCALGTSQEKSATTSCTPCPPGSYTDTRGRETCNMCDQGLYQILEGQTGCISCDEVRTTRLLAASRREDCVCKQGFIEALAGVCVSCGEGLSCPVGSTVERLRNSSSEERPEVLPMYFSSMEAPLETYRCQSHCPGGTPGSCDGGHVGRTCSECPENFYSTGRQCAECGVALPALWVVGFGMVFCGILGSYYLLTSNYTPKASALTCTTCSFGMMTSLFQTLGVIQAVAVPWPTGLGDVASFFEIFVLDLDSLGFSCIAGGPVQRFAVTCASFFVVLSSLVATAFLTNLLLPRRLSWLAWQKYKTMSTIGQFCQVSFTTMTNIGLVPFMCYRHPAGSESVLKYSDVFCNSTEHTLMQLLGMAVLALSGAFLTSCFFFAWKAPSWSGKAVQGGVRFLIFRFRPNVWWFGLVLVTRGPLLSMPAVAAPNMPAVQLVCLSGILLLFLQLQIWYLPWKAPILNLVDGVTNLLLVMLLASGLGRLGPDPGGGPAVLDSLAAAISAMMMSVLGFMLVLALVALFYRQALGGKDELWIMNLGKAPSSKEFCDNLTNFLHCQKDMQESQVRQVVEALCVYDYRDVNASIVLLSAELGFRSKLTDVGPEGGWVDYEVEMFRKHGFVQVSLGSRILTTDVALVSLVALTVDSLAREAPQKAHRNLPARAADALARLVPCC
eukprot:s666_g8.t3